MTTGVRLVADGILDAELEETARDVDGAGDDALLDLVRLADVEGEGAFLDEAAGLEDVHLADLALDLIEQIAVGDGHSGRSRGAEYRVPSAES